MEGKRRKMEYVRRKMGDERRNNGMQKTKDGSREMEDRGWGWDTKDERRKMEAGRRNGR